MGLSSLAGGQPKATTAGNVTTTQSVRSASHGGSASHAPKIISATQKKKGNTERVYKVAVIGPAGTGKTFTIFSLMKHLAVKEHLRPEEIRFELIDLDSGIDELTDQCIVPDEYLDRLFISTCQTFSEVVDATKEAMARLREHKQEHGLKGAWLIVDNMEKAWQYPQEDYCQAVYGMSLVEKMKLSRKSQLEAKRTGGKGEPVFNQNTDWSVINPMYMDWAKSFEVCGLNFLWLSPWKAAETKNAEGIVTEVTEKFGQAGNNQKVSHIVRKYYDSTGGRRAEFIKSRTTKGLPKNLKDTTWSGMFFELEKLEELEKRQKVADMQRDEYPTAPVAKPAMRSIDVSKLPVASALQDDFPSDSLDAAAFDEANETELTEKDKRVNEILQPSVDNGVAAVEKAIDNSSEISEYADW